MATIAQLIQELNAVQSTPSGLVEWNNNSLESVMTNGVQALLLERGLMQVADVAALQLVGGAESNAVAIPDGGYFIWLASGSPDYVTIFPAAGGGVWKQQFVQDPAVALAGLVDVVITSPSNNQILQYNSSTSKWINAVVPGGALQSLSDVNMTLPLVDGDMLIYKLSTSEWVNANGLITVDPANGNTNIAGDITLDGNKLILSASNGSINVNGLTFTVDGSTGNVNFIGNLTINNGVSDKFKVVSSSGDVAVNTNKFTVAGASGNTAIAGTLGVGANFSIDGLGNTTAPQFIGTASLGNPSFNSTNGNYNTVSGNFITINGNVQVTNGLIAFGGSKVNPVRYFRTLTQVLAVAAPPVGSVTKKIAINDGTSTVYLYGYNS